jgi:hypothetical protein
MKRYPGWFRRKTLEEAMKDHVLASGKLMAHYQKRK